MEANIVLLTDCGKRFNMQDLYSRLLFDEEMGFGPDFADTENRVVYPTAAKNAIALKQKRETLAEEMRLLYVALTRARQKLILVGSYQNAQNKLHTLYSQMLSRGDYAVYAAQNAGCYLDWICLLYTSIMAYCKRLYTKTACISSCERSKKILINMLENAVPALKQAFIVR